MSARPSALISAHQGAMATMIRAEGRLERVKQAADRWLAGGPLARPTAEPSLVPLLVLVVDDEQAILSVVRRILEQAIEGCTVLLAHSAEAARVLLGVASALPSVVLLDLNLGDALGWDLATELPDAMRVILMSGAVDDERFAALAARLGARWLGKPFAVDALIAMVREELRAPVTAAHASEPPVSGPEEADDDGPSMLLPRGPGAPSTRG